MDSTENRIAAGLERAFARHGFAQASVDDLRAACDVSLRTLYRHAPSRGQMVLIALEHRHSRYMARLTEDLPQTGVLDAVLERVADWMRTEAPQGCLFHAAVAAAPDDPALREMLSRHKTQMARAVAEACDLSGREPELTLVLEGLTQSWVTMGDAALTAARRMAVLLKADQQAA